MAKFQWKSRYNILAVLFVTWAVAIIDRMAMPIALPYIAKEFNLGPFQTSLVLSTFFIGYAIGHLPGGYLADRIGARKVATAALFCWSAFTAFTGAASNLVHLLIVRFLFGLGEGSFPAASFKAVATWFAQKERATATAVMLTANSVGAAISPLIVVAMMAAWGWRGVFYALLIPGAIACLLCWYFLRDNPADVPGISAEELSETTDGEEPTVAQRGSLRSVLQVDTVKYALALLIFDFAYWGFQSWLPTYLIQVRHFSMLEMGAAASLPFVAGAAGRLVGGWLSDTIFQNRRGLLVMITQLLSGVFLFIMFVTPTTWALVIAQTLAGLFLSTFQSTFWALPMSTIEKDKIGMATGFINMAGQVGGLLSPLIIGGLLQVSNGSFGVVGIFLEVSILVSIVIVLTLPVSWKKSAA